MVVGLIYVAVALLIGRFGTRWIDLLLPPVVIGSVVMVIGLGLARVAVDMAAVFFKGFLGVIPVLIGILGGYAVAFLAGQVDLSAVRTARAFAVPPFVLPRFDAGAILLLAPVSLVVITPTYVARDISACEPVRTVQSSGSVLHLYADGQASPRP